ncbi:unnamed protein product, partial [marine sediment metagenome]
TGIMDETTIAKGITSYVTLTFDHTPSTEYTVELLSSKGNKFSHTATSPS